MSRRQHDQAGSAPRRSLRETLRNLLFFRNRNTSQAKNIGSGVLRRADISAVPRPFLPGISVVSLFPDFGRGSFNIAPPTDHRHERTATLHSHTRPSRQSLLPRTSLSQFNLHAAFVGKVQQPYDVVFDSIPDQLRCGHSRQASLVSVQSYSGERPRSTLRLRPSNPNLADEHISDVSSPPRTQRTTAELGVSTVTRTERPAERNKNLGKPRPTGMGHGLVRHFYSFCVLDTATPGYPVTATSKDLRYVFDVGEEFFLNNEECRDVQMDVVTGCDAEGNPVTHLVLFNPLCSSSSGRSRFMLASLVDITDFIRDSTSSTEMESIPELETILEDSQEDDDIQTPSTGTRHMRWPNSSYDLSAEDLLGGCYLDDELARPRVHLHDPDVDIWVHLASEERVKHRARVGTVKNGNDVLRQPVARPRSREVPRSYQLPSSALLTAHRVNDDLLDDFIFGLQEVYADFFLLAKSPFDAYVYEICNVSPTVFAGKDYLHGHLQHTPTECIIEMSDQLSQNMAFHLDVKWGEQAVDKQLYCIPLFTESSTTWLCFLVNKDVGYLW